MRLNDVLQRNNCTSFVAGAYIAIPITYADYGSLKDLWHCSDYVVTSVQGGCVYLVKRKGPGG